MTTFNLSKLAVLLTAAAASVSVVSATDLPDGVVHLPVKGFRTNVHPNPRIRNDPRFTKRSTSDTVSVKLDNEFTFYSVDVKLGTPFQTIEVAIDTGSSDFWVIASNNSFCTTNEELIEEGEGIDCKGFSFDTSDSSTFQYNSSGAADEFSIQYGDGTTATGNWGTDIFEISGVSLNDTSVAVAEKTNTTSGILGISFEKLESTYVNSDSDVTPFTYPNVPVLMVSQGHIKKNAYSLWLNDLNANSGSLLFGGVDHSKYSGTLQTVPLINTIEGVSKPMEMTVVLSSVSLVDNSGSSSTIMSGNIAALLDSGTSLTYLPTQVLEVIGDALDGTYSSDLGLYVVPCNAGGSKGGISYNFSGAKITVSLEQLMFALTSEDGSAATFQDGTLACALGVSAATDTIILGDTFLRNAYVVYDLDDYEISLANAVLDSSDSDIEAIKSSVPSATAAPSYSSTDLATQVVVQSPSSLTFSDEGTYAGGGATTVSGDSEVIASTSNIESGLATTVSISATGTLDVSGTSTSASNTGSSKSGAANLKISSAFIGFGIIAALLIV